MNSEVNADNRQAYEKLCGKQLSNDSVAEMTTNLARYIHMLAEIDRTIREPVYSVTI